MRRPKPKCILQSAHSAWGFTVSFRFYPYPFETLTEHPKIPFPDASVTLLAFRTGWAQSLRWSFAHHFAVVLGLLPCKQGWTQSCSVHTLPLPICLSVSLVCLGPWLLLVLVLTHLITLQLPPSPIGLTCC